MTWGLDLLEFLVLVYFLVVNGFYSVLVVAAALELRRVNRERRWENQDMIVGARVTPRISILSPAHNEEASIVEAVRALLNHHYPRIEVVVIDDGSKDATLARLVEAFQLQASEPLIPPYLQTKPILGVYRSPRSPNLVVVQKANGGKSDALNVGLLLASGDLCCVVDADTLLDPGALSRLVRPFLVSDDVVAAGGTLRVVNACRVEHSRVKEVRTPRSWLAGVQCVEYVRAFLVGRLGLNWLGGNLIISGAFGLFRRAEVLACGGYATDTVGEDMELVVRLRRLGMEQGTASKVEFVPDPVAWTEVPSGAKVLSRQRNRWQRGLCDSLWRHFSVCLNPAYGRMGLLAFPYQLFIELVSPLVEGMGWILLVVTALLGSFDVAFAVGFFLAAYGFGTLLTAASMLFEEACFPGERSLRERLWLALWALVEGVGYRQWVLLGRLQGILKWFQGHHEWGRMERVGFRK